MDKSNTREFRIYKPNSKKAGTALKIQCTTKPKNVEGTFRETMLFAEIAKQTGVDENDNARFDWMGSPDHKGNSITMKLGLPDVSEMLLVLYGIKEFAGSQAGTGLFHKNKNGNTVMRFKRMDNGSIAMNLSTSKTHNFSIMLTQGESVLLRLLLQEFVIRYHNW